MHQRDQNSEEFFKKIVFELPYMLEDLATVGGKFILTVPYHLDKNTTVSDKAYYLEGARVALTWASCYFRFDGLDVDVIRAPENVPLAELIEEALYSNLMTYKG